ncbi:MAG TPA: hypothetical protein VFP50_17925 [Anaeromyxobacteraceae bacterium]|nr:hypothetical protein [Anaeromyxobacteraceae bacterium]
MEIDRKALQDAASRGIITPAQAEHLWTDLSGTRRTPSWPAGAVDASLWRPVAAAMALALGAAVALDVAFAELGFGGLATAATALAFALYAVGRQRWVRTRGARGQVLLTAAVLLAPLAAHGAARLVGWGRPPDPPYDLVDWLAGPWFPVQAAAALAAALVVRTFDVPAMSGVLGAAAWFAAQDAAVVVFGPSPGWAQRALLSALTGVVLVGAGMAVDRRTRADHAFWLYLTGLLAFTGGLVTWQAGSDVSAALVGGLHLWLVALAVILGRHAFAVAGAIGVAASAGRLAEDLLDGRVVAFVVAAVVLLIVWAGIAYARHRGPAAAWISGRAPEWFRRLLPPGVPANP